MTDDSNRKTTDDKLPSQPHQENNHGVIIIGAGSAGLTAGYDLKRRGIPFIVLEAGHRLGGRVGKLEDPTFADFPIDVGGEWIHTHPKILRRIVDDPSIDLSGIQTRLYQFAPFYEWRNKRWRLKYSQWDDYDFYYKFIRYTWFDFFDDFIAAPIREDIYYGCVITRIDHDKEIVVTCQDGRTFRGDQVIVTVSLSVLRDGDIAFNPPLPEAKQAALQQVPLEPGLKVFLEFSEKFYFRDFVINDSGAVHGEMYYYDESHLQNSKRHILGFFVYGDKDKRYVSLEDHQIVKLLLQDLDKAYKGKASATYLKHYVQNWSTFPHVRGSYSSYRRRGIKPMWEIAKPMNNAVFFCGEALPANGASYGYVHHAALSGRQAAKAVECVRTGKKIPTNWHAWMIHVLATVCCGLEHRLFFRDTD